MSLPPGFMDELRERVSLAAVAGRKVTWDQRKSNPGKGDYWAPCPFHQEKTASFHLDDRKGFYYCFGCHAKGDALNFVQETENVGFMEAVGILAREAGMEMPQRDPEAAEREDRRKGLADAMELAVQFFRMQLHSSRGTEARDYLTGRGLDEDTEARFELGFAPDSRSALVEHLTGKGVTHDQIVEAGLGIRPDEGGTPFDRFRGRIMFPIRDTRGRCIAFGGRAMRADARAKYLNSPETPLFDKGRTLYHHGPAREAAGKSGRLIVAEGYMDVIALARAGFGETVAPLGTAITETQLQLIWRLANEPIIALDGDKAGLRAAMRLIDLALPMLEPGRSLRFCLLPEGQDPDDLLKSQGRAAMEALLNSARPLVDLLWQRETEGQVFDSPERRAGLDQRLKAAIALIPDQSLRNHYGAAIRELRAELFAPRARSLAPEARRTGGFRKDRPQVITNTKSSALASGSNTTEHLREALILALCLSHSEIVPLFESALEKLTLSNEAHRRLRDLILEQGDAATLDAVRQTLGDEPVDALMRQSHVRISPLIRNPGDRQMAEKALAEELAKLEAMRGAMNEISDAMHDMEGAPDEGLTWRLSQATQARESAFRSTLPEGGTEAEDRSAMSDYLQNLIDNQVWVKKKR